MKEFIRVSFSDHVEFRVIPGRVRLASGSLCGVLSKLGDRMKIPVFTSSPSGSFPLLGTAWSLNSAGEFIMYETSTIGGIISIGDWVYGLTVAHSVREAKTTMHLRPPESSCGTIEFYEWSGDDDTEREAMLGFLIGGNEPAVGMDWMLVDLDQDYVAFNTFKSLDGTVQQRVARSLKISELLDDEVWIVSRRPQIGILDCTPTVILGQVSYDVFSIALEVPLGECIFFSFCVPLLICHIPVLGDSGSWVVKDNNLCGYIFATLDPEPWAYMLPIEPVFNEISRVCRPEAFFGH